MKSNRSRFVVLGLLARGPASGYDLKKMVANELHHFWNESYGQIYPILKLLADERLAVRRVERNEGRPYRQIYTITPRGRQALDQWLVEEASFQVSRNETLLKLFFGAQTDSSTSRSLIERYRDHHSQITAACDEMDRAARNGGRDAGLPYRLMTIAHCRQQARAAVRWSDQALREIDALGSKRPRSPKKRTRTPR